MHVAPSLDVYLAYWYAAVIKKKKIKMPESFGLLFVQ